MTIHIEDKQSGEVKAYTVKGAEDLTLDDWRDLTAVKVDGDDLSNTIAMLERHTGITKEQIMRLTPDSADALLDAMGQSLSDALSMRDQEGEVPRSIEHEGVTYAVPQDLDADTIAGQWWDFRAAYRLEHEADIMIRTLAVLLIPGEEYDGNPDSRMDTMGRMKIRDAFNLSAFFFDSSQRYRTHTRQQSKALLTSISRRIGQAAKSSLIDTKS